MRRISLFILALVMCLSLCACGSGTTKEAEETITSVEDIDWDDTCSSLAAVNARRMYKQLYSLEIPFDGTNIATVEQTEDGSYTCYGKISGKDKYGNSCSAEFSVTYSVDLEKAQVIIDNNGIDEENPDSSNPYIYCLSLTDYDYGQPRK